MSWTVQGDKRYYYRSQRIGTRVRRVYVAANEEADLAEALDKQLRAERAKEREVKKAIESKLEEDHLTVIDLSLLTDFMAKASLILGGFRQHDRGIWVKRTPKNSPLSGTTETNN